MSDRVAIVVWSDAENSKIEVFAESADAFDCALRVLLENGFGSILVLSLKELAGKLEPGDNWNCLYLHPDNESNLRFASLYIQ